MHLHLSRVSHWTMAIILNDLEVKSSDVVNVYINAFVTEKVWKTLGPEFGKDAKKTAVIVRELYGLKSAGEAFRSPIFRCIDLWLKSETRPGDGVLYYS